ncbi:putative repeat protein (TIGR01451 family) [Sphingomonas jinjuensis]|uniref:Putative repeat protein (TIGR01451 family) n=1 Tax=Sphingomonas jinjuensis TaxID=535907 RepID=A0A840F8G0_9SPHN|nr:DUF11 domain-containing protein [Sphingomonas jinjuensis]MBB4152576.1 putative repeat protein (TIGR01451 family) [Sphingomonas jinjuensis]
MPIVHRLILLVLVLIGVGVQPAAAQTRVENRATLTFTDAGGPRSVASNLVSLDVMAAAKRPTRISFRFPAPDFRFDGMVCQTTPVMAFTPAPVDEAALAASTPAARADAYADMFVVLEAEGQNRDPARRDTAVLDVDVGPVHTTLPLLETGVDTGVFAGGVPATASGKYADLVPCDVRRVRGVPIRLSFTEDDRSLASTVDLLIDPAGYVFDSTNGRMVDGAIVSIVDADGKPAAVIGEDGTSAYPSTVVTGQTVTDASGRVYPGLPGRYRFPLLPPGTYFLKITPPAGYTAPSLASDDAIGRLRDPLGGRFLVSAASSGGPIVLATPDPVYVDVPVDPIGTQGSGKTPDTLLLTKIASVRDASPGDIVQYRLLLENRGTAPESDVHLLDTLPVGLRYEPRSTRGASEPTVSSDGRQLDFAMTPLAPGGSVELRYVVTIAPGAPVGPALNRARAFSRGNASAEAAASVRLRPLAFSDAITIVGRVSEGACGDPAERRKGIPGVRLLLEDGTFVVTDRDGLYHIEGARAGRHVVQLDTGSIPASYEPVACDTDSRQAGSAISRFVEGVGNVVKRVDFQLRPTGRTVNAAAALPIEVLGDAEAAGSRDWLAGQMPGVAWLFPAVDHNPRAPVLRVAIKHLPGQRVALTVNGTQTDPLAFDGTDTSGIVAVTRWSGLPLIDGDNRLEARILTDDGRTVETLSRTVHYAGAPVRAAFDAAKSRLVADGIRQPLLAVRITDASGRPVRAGTLVPFSVEQPYAAAQELDLEQRRQLAGLDRGATTARVVGDDGYAFIALQPTTQAGGVSATVMLGGDTRVERFPVRAWLEATRNQWIVVGFGAGSLGFEQLSRHGRSLPRVERNRLVGDGQLALYAKGRIKGSWLLTIAYDSDRRYDPDRGLLGTIDPDRYYTVYGDGSRQGYDAATAKKLYLRLERREFYALFGDIETAMTDTQLTRYSRTLTGAKAAYQGRWLRASGFVARTAQLYRRDEIQGNGLSGPYRLSSSDIVPNSDKLRIEVRDRFRSERIVASTSLTRHIDYDIDAVAGTIRFREPVLSRDAALNPTFIVVDYEVEGGRGGKLAAGGRVAARVGRVEIGAAALRDETLGRATVVGADLRAKVAAGTEVRAEVATGGRAGLSSGTAILAEAEHHGGGVDVIGYVRQQDVGFGLGQQNLVEAGTRKVGLDGRVAIADRFSLAGSAWYQDMLVGSGRRVAGDARIEYRRPGGTLFAGGQFADDRGIDGRDRSSRLLMLGGSKSLFDGKLTLGGQTQFAPGGDKASVDFPIRHQLTAAWRVTPGIRLLGGYEITDGRDYAARTAQIGFDVAPWTGAKLMSTLNQQAIGENGARTFAQYGLNQSLPIGKRWTIDATLDAASTVRGRIPQGAVVNPLQPVASAGFLGRDQLNGDYAAVTLGATYRSPRWSWNGRIEYRDGTRDDRWGLISNVLRSLGEGRTLASSVRAYRLTDGEGRVATSAAADVALAWRPLDSRWSILERLVLRHEDADAGFRADNVLAVPTFAAGTQATTRIVNNLAVNYRSGPEGLGHGIEATVYYGAKYVQGRFADDRFDGYIDVTGFDLRRDIGTRFDIGVQGSVQHGWDRGTWSWSGGPSVGVSPATNVWISAGWNVAGYRDRDFEDDRYTRQGPYVTMRLKFDQLSLGAAGRALGIGR